MLVAKPIPVFGMNTAVMCTVIGDLASSSYTAKQSGTGLCYHYIEKEKCVSHCLLTSQYCISQTTALHHLLTGEANTMCTTMHYDTLI